jgi:hypothetical protein
MFRALWAPGETFARVEDVARYAWPLVVLLALMTLIGYATVQTGLIDREVDREVQARIALIDASQRDVVDRAALRDLYEGARKAGEFKRVVMHLAAVAAGPVGLLMQTLLVAAVFFVAVALTGRKTEWHALLTLTVYAGLVDVVAGLVRLAFMLRFATLEVDTSLAIAVRHLCGETSLPAAQQAALAGLGTAVDPFRIWYWLMLVIGLRATRQLPGWRAGALCGACWLVAGLARAALAAAGA